MSDVESNKSVCLMRYHNTIKDISISITDSNGMEIFISDEDIRFIYEVINKWLQETK